MRIAQIAPLYETGPSKFCGNIKRSVLYLSDALVALGHDVTLFASGDSQTAARLETVWPRALHFNVPVRDPMALNMLLIEHVRRVADHFDVLHFHLDYLPFPLFSDSSLPFVTTLHGRLDLPELQPVFDVFSHIPVVSVSHAQRTPLPQANWLRTIYPGLPIHSLRPQRIAQPDYLAFIGHICPENRIETAIQIAAQSGLPLKLAATADLADQTYFKTKIEPLLMQTEVEFVGELNAAQQRAFLSGAKALLMTSDCPESFSLVMIEAMACGTPVIAFNRGWAPEIVDHGVTGFVVDDAASAIHALNWLDELSGEEIREQFERRFTSETMAQNYIDVYETLTQTQKSPMHYLAVG